MVNVEAIRPANLADEFKNLLHREIVEYFFDSSGKMRPDRLETVPCPACGHDVHTLFMEKDGFLLQTCSRCELIFVNPRPTEAAQIEFFASSKAIGLYSEMVAEKSTQRISLIFQPLADLILGRWGRGGGELLEVGCGSGLLLDTLAAGNSGWSLSGVEPNARAVEICLAKGLNVIHGGVEHLTEDKPFDLIVFWAVFDHFSDPFSIVLKCFRLLKPGASILIGNINIYGFDSIILGRDNPAFQLPERQNFFGIKSMKAMLERSGFADIRIETTGKLDVEVAKDYWESGGSNERTRFLESIVLGSDALRKSFQAFLTRENLSGHMTITATKPL